MRRNVLHLAVIFAVASGCARFRLDRDLRSSSQDWMMLGGSPSRANASKNPLKPPLAEQWQYNSVAGISATPLVRDSLIAVGTLNGELQLVSITNGKRLGYLTLEGPVIGTPAWDKNSVIVPLASGDETLISISLNDLSFTWRTNVGPVESSPLIYEDYIYVTTLDGKIFCLDKNDGVEKWKFKTETDEFRKPIRSSPASDGATVVFGCDDGYVYAVDRKAGSLRWKFRTKASVFATPVLLNDDVVIGSLDGTVYCLAMRTGSLVWQFQTGSKVYASASTNGSSVFIAAADGKCYALDGQKGNQLWAFEARSVVSCAPLVSGEVLYFGSLDKTLYAIRANTGQVIWEYVAVGRIRVSPVLWGKTLLVTSEDRYITALVAP